MREYSPNTYENPDHSSYNSGAIILSVAAAIHHLEEFQKEHLTPPAEETLASNETKPEFPQAS